MQHNESYDASPAWLALRTQLINAGEEPDQELLTRIMAQGSAVVPGLIDVITDKDLLHPADDDDPAGWAPLHAIKLLGDLRSAEAVEPLLSLLVADEYWPDDSIEQALSTIGRPALQALRARLFDASIPSTIRTRVVVSLARLAERHPEASPEVVDVLIAQLDNVEGSSADDDGLNGMIISNLLDLGAEKAADSVKRAFDEERVDTMIVTYDEAAHTFGLPARDEKAPPAGNVAGAGVTLHLKCKACGAERPHQIKIIYYDTLTAERRLAGEKTPYSEYIIPERITCPKCGAVDQYEFGNKAMLTLAAQMFGALAQQTVGGAGPVNLESPLVMQRFTIADGREMHPYEARDMYRNWLEEEPQRADLRVLYGNVLEFLGFESEAFEQYQAAAEQDPENIAALFQVGARMYVKGEMQEARRYLEQVCAVAAGKPSLDPETQEFVEEAAQTLHIISLLTTERPTFLSNRPQPFTSPQRQLNVAPSSPAITQEVPRRVEKVGRNDPCPCGSGKKYKKCHGS